jgi:hypothetical protein
MLWQPPERSMPKLPPRFATPRGRSRFSRPELARAIRAARDAGCEHAKVEVDPSTGKITIIVDGKPGENVTDNEVENWVSKHANQR